MKLQIDYVWPEVGCCVACDSITIDMAVFIVTDLKKYTSCRCNKRLCRAKNKTEVVLPNYK